MVNRNLLRQFDLSDNELQQELREVFTRADVGSDVERWLPPEEQDFEVNKLIKGRVVNIVGDDVVIDVGYKSEGIIPLQEWYDEGDDKVHPPRIGEEIQVLLDAVEDEGGVIVLSYRKAKRQKEWEDVIAKHKEGDVISGLVTRKIKGGLLVNIGVNVFLPASQVDIRRPPDIADYINKTIECKILKIDEPRRNIVVSRRKLLEDQREEMKKKLLSEIEVGQIRKGVVKNIAEFGAFVDLGGIDGLLHITDMSWAELIIRMR
jgi:small subunit ribosomal protein S1